MHCSSLEFLLADRYGSGDPSYSYWRIGTDYQALGKAIRNHLVELRLLLDIFRGILQSFAGQIYNNPVCSLNIVCISGYFARLFSLSLKYLAASLAAGIDRCIKQGIKIHAFAFVNRYYIFSTIYFNGCIGLSNSRRCQLSNIYISTGSIEYLDLSDSAKACAVLKAVSHLQDFLATTILLSHFFFSDSFLAKGLAIFDSDLFIPVQTSCKSYISQVSVFVGFALAINISQEIAVFNCQFFKALKSAS
ncbi:predicted protein [Aspergillus nidulans FGSC A4]|uniref:Uncharacterized protein n=1 Tax=Emericella nidulans (strain FGSC A4 / ATCC 38163 / CBS 112.46 / NRRL 194 / M139) TaxID=227321 RepID=Q5AWA9_EMENI|nr:hypothetical protein [Aspergillus nidulans FGSC A4]EAA61792.1 predicted protein [Aspergillus nidulans FGSC A4]CBF78409.1 TPA: hypothetical protein ANIA_07421 [Aspergillus nidulans FGSC A4]|eukprot:XP_680690.1 predicted protein [Aspergillus nidulans FGSC A4]